MEGLDSVGIGVGEGVVEENGQAAVVVGGEDLGHGKADGGGDLLLGSTTEGLESEGGIAGAEEFEAFDSCFREVDADLGGGAEDALEVAGNTVGEGLDERAVNGFAGRGEELVEKRDGLGVALLGEVGFRGGSVAGQRVTQFGVGISTAVKGEAVAGDEAEIFGLAAAGFLLGDGAGEAVEIGGEDIGDESCQRGASGGEERGSLLLGVAGPDESFFAGCGITVGFLKDLEFGFEVAEGLAGLGGLVSVGLEMGGGGFEAMAELTSVVASGRFGFFSLIECLLEVGAKLTGSFEICRKSVGGIQRSQTALDLEFRGFVSGGGGGEFGG